MVEGLVDEAAARKLVSHCGARAAEVYEKNGKAQLRQKLTGYNRAAQFSHWLVLMDLDEDADCAPEFKRQCLDSPSPLMCFRVAVREIESWFLADREGLATFLSVPRASIPNDPDSITDPKGFVVDLASSSRRREIREDMVPRLGAGRQVGPAYTSRLIEFVQAQWDLDRAANRSDSLARALSAISAIGGTPLPS